MVRTCGSSSEFSVLRILGHIALCFFSLVTPASSLAALFVSWNERTVLLLRMVGCLTFGGLSVLQNKYAVARPTSRRRRSIATTFTVFGFKREQPRAFSARPNVRAKRATTVGRQARAGENVRVPPARAWWPAVGAPLERGVRPRLNQRVSKRDFSKRTAAL